jgi:putative ABC transport system permease protein
VLGASVTNVTALLSIDFIKLVLIAIIVSSPISWYAMSKWLEEFKYRIEIEPWIFLTAGLIAVFIALITIGSQAVRAAVANPLKSLRAE